jgi:hypothetical protein
VGREIHQENEEYLMERFTIVPAGRVYANQMANRVRETDKLEVYRSSGMDIRSALLESVEVSDDDMCWAATYNGLPVAMFGANNITVEGAGPYSELSIGGIWLLATPGIYWNKRDFMRKCKKYLAIMHTRYEYLTNFIDADNVPTLMWLPRLGFRPAQQIDDYGHSKTPFIQYVSKRS